MQGRHSNARRSSIPWWCDRWCVATPRSGRKALYFGNQVSIGIVGWPEDRAREFIRQLTTHACQPAYQYRHRWRVGDAVLWDNRRVLHAGTFYNIETRRA